MYRVELTRSAEKSFRRVPQDVRRRIGEALRIIAAEPTRPHPASKPLKGELAGLMRLRVGDWRVIYRLEHDALLVLVIKIGARGDVYG